YALILSLIAVVFFASMNTAHAQANAGIRVAPAIVQDNAAPGENFKFSLTVTNVSGEDKTFYLSTEDIKGVDDSGHPIFAEAGEPTGFEISSWINIPEPSVKLKGGQSTTVPFDIKVPEGAAPGAHFGVVFVEDRPIKPGSNGAAI